MFDAARLGAVVFEGDSLIFCRAKDLSERLLLTKSRNEDIIE